MKMCSKCNSLKDERDFYKRDERRSKSGLSSHCKSCQKEYRVKNRDRINAKSKQYYELTRDHQSKRKSTYYKAYKSDLDHKHREYHRASYKKYRERILDVLGRVCVRCGFDDVRALQIDHINGGGSKDRTRKGCETVLREIYLLSPSQMRKKFQTLCANCNQIKKHENNEFRRKV